MRNLHVFRTSDGRNSLAVLDVQWRLTNIHSSEDQNAPDRQGHSKFVLKEVSFGKWKVLAHKVYRQNLIEKQRSEPFSPKG